MLPIRDRLRIARAARRGERLDDPSEATLAAGSAQYQQQLLFNSRIGDPRVQLVFAFVVTLIGVLARSPSIVALGLAIIALSAWRLSRLKARRENLAQAEEFNGIRPSGRSG
jgi:flagellar biosynthesis component FlhA